MGSKKQRSRRVSDWYSTLTPREYEIAVWFGRGSGPKEISIRLGITLATVNARLGRIVDALGLKSRAELREMFVPNWDRIDGEDR